MFQPPTYISIYLTLNTTIYTYVYIVYIHKPKHIFAHEILEFLYAASMHAYRCISRTSRNTYKPVYVRVSPYKLTLIIQKVLVDLIYPVHMEQDLDITPTAKAAVDITMSAAGQAASAPGNDQPGLFFERSGMLDFRLLRLGGLYHI